MSHWDDWFKRLVRINPEAFTSWLLTDARYQKIENSELSTRNPSADALLSVSICRKKAMLHIEFQSSSDQTMGHRMLEYNILAHSQYNVPVYSYVICLKKEAKIPRSPYINRFPDGRATCVFHYGVIELWRLSAEELLKSNQLTLLALLPLTRGGQDRKCVEQALTILKEHQQSEALTLSFLIANAVYKKEDDREWLKRRYQALFDENLEDNWFYQTIVQKGLEKGVAQGLEKGLEKGRQEGRQEGLQEGRQEGLQEMIDGLFIPMIRERFPQLTDLAKQRTKHIQDASLLSRLTLKIIHAQSVDDARQLLQASDESLDQSS